MTAMTHADEPPDTDRTGPSPPRWEFPEVAAVVVLAAVGVLALGGLATGIARSTQGGTAGGLPGRVYVGTSVLFGSLWASFVLAAVLLGLIGLCWWHLGEWEPASEDEESSHGTAEALGHASRTRSIVVWVQVALVVTAAGAISELVGALLETVGSGGAARWAADFNAGANALAVLAMAVTGVVLGRRLTNLYGKQ